MADAKAETQAPRGNNGQRLITGVVSAIIAGVVSFYVAHWQSQDAARQAIASQRVLEVIQLKTAGARLAAAPGGRFRGNMRVKYI